MRLMHRTLPPMCSMGPGPSDLNTVNYGYTSSVDVQSHALAGLVGAQACLSPVFGRAS